MSRSWLGELPPGWRLTKLGSVARPVVGRTPPTDDQSNFDGTYPWVTIADLKSKVVSDTSKGLSDSAVKLNGMRPITQGSLMMSFKLSVGTVAFAGRDLYTNEAIATFVDDGRLNLRYAYYALPIFVLENAGENIYGAKILNLQGILSTQLALPDAATQAAIADFLDAETSQIDAFIADQGQLIGLVRERREAVVEGLLRQHAGSHPTAIKHVAKLLPGYAFRSEDFVPPNEGRRLLRGVNVGVGRLDWADSMGWSGFDDVERYRVRRGDVVLGMDRPIISGGIRVAEVPPEDDGALLVQRVLRIRGRQLPSRYLAYALATRAFRAHIEPNFTGVSVPHLSEGQVGEFRLGVPPHEEAVRSVLALDDHTSEVDAAIADAREAIALSRERRAALITAAVTGQIDVTERERLLV